MDEENPKIETEAEGVQEVDEVNKARQFQDDGNDEGQDEAEYDNNLNDSPDPNEESPEKGQDDESPEGEGEDNGGGDEPQRDQDSPVGSPEGQAVYDRHQLDGQQYEDDQEGEDYRYDEEGKNFDYNQDDEETKRLNDDENEEELQPLDPDHHPDEEDPIQKKIRAIIELCEQTNGMYGDSDFPPNDASLYINPAEPPDYAEQTPVVEWMRPEEALKSGDSDKVAMIKNGMKPGDVKQGTLGDCWLLGSFMVLATHPELLHNLIVKD